MASEEQAYEIKRKYSLQLLQQPGVCGVGVEKDPTLGFVITVHLDPEYHSAANNVPGLIEGIPIKRVQSGPFRKQATTK
jgi:hypothetical protein